MGERLQTWLAAGAVAAFHAAAVTIIAVVLALLVFDLHTIDWFAYAWFEQGFEPAWSSLALHVGLSVGLWAVAVVGWRLWRHRVRQKKQARVVRLSQARGAVFVETLVVLVPLLLLTSGLAQLAMLNVAGLLSDLAAYQGARTAWIWQPEADAGRSGVTDDDVQFRARTAAAMVLAPTAGSDFTVGRNFPRGSGPPFRRIRTGITAAFRPGQMTGEMLWTASGYNWDYFGMQRKHATHDNLTFNHAFDSVSFELRAARKSTQAWMNLREFQIVDRDDEIGVHFTYQYDLLFPWFAYIWGPRSTIAMRSANHVGIEREFMMPKQPPM